MRFQTQSNRYDRRLVRCCTLPVVTQAILKPHQVLRDARLAADLTLRELAYFAGCSHTTISRLERGDLDVAPLLKARIARVLRVPVCDLWPPESEVS
jgi:DNA-binding XRE family transcriptional regulator